MEFRCIQSDVNFFICVINFKDSIQLKFFLNCMLSLRNIQYCVLVWMGAGGGITTYGIEVIAAIRYLLFTKLRNLQWCPGREGVLG